MRVLVLSRPWPGGPPGAGGVAEAFAAGWAEETGDRPTALPVTDGGPGFCEAMLRLVERSQGSPGSGREDRVEVVPVTVDPVGDATSRRERGPTGTGRAGAGPVVPEPSPLVVVHHRAAAPTVYVDAGLPGIGDPVPDGVPAPDRHALLRAGSSRAGRLLEAALSVGPGRVVLGVGRDGPLDGGAGLLAALAGRDGAGPGPGTPRTDGGVGHHHDPDEDALDRVAAEAVEDLGRVRGAWSGVDLVAAAADAQAPLLGLDGVCARWAGPRPDPVHAARAAQREQTLSRFVATASRVVREDERAGGSPRSLLASGPPPRASAPAGSSATAPGSGAGGGVGFAVGLLGGRVLPGARVCAVAADLDRRAAASDLVVVLEPTLDGTSLGSGCVGEAVRAAQPHAVPVVVVAGASLAGRREWSAAGVSAVYGLADDSPSRVVERAVRAAGRRLAVTWATG